MQPVPYSFGLVCSRHLSFCLFVCLFVYFVCAGKAMGEGQGVNTRLHIRIVKNRIRMHILGFIKSIDHSNQSLCLFDKLHIVG